MTQELSINDSIEYSDLKELIKAENISVKTKRGMTGYNEVKEKWLERSIDLISNSVKAIKKWNYQFQSYTNLENDNLLQQQIDELLALNKNNFASFIAGMQNINCLTALLIITLVECNTHKSKLYTDLTNSLQGKEEKLSKDTSILLDQAIEHLKTITIFVDEGQLDSYTQSVFLSKSWKQFIIEFFKFSTLYPLYSAYNEKEYAVFCQIYKEQFAKLLTKIDTLDKQFQTMESNPNNTETNISTLNFPLEEANNIFNFLRNKSSYIDDLKINNENLDQLSDDFKKLSLLPFKYGSH